MNKPPSVEPRFTVEAIAARIDALEPKDRLRASSALRETVWPPMTYMLIPSLLAEADRLLEELRLMDPEREDVAITKQLDRLAELRRGFRRLG